MSLMLVLKCSLSHYRHILAFLVIMHNALHGLVPATIAISGFFAFLIAIEFRYVELSIHTT